MVRAGVGPGFPRWLVEGVEGRKGCGGEERKGCRGGRRKGWRREERKVWRNERRKVLRGGGIERMGEVEGWKERRC